LAWAEFWYNTSFNASAGMVPFKALYGRDPPSVFRLEDSPLCNMAVNEQLRARDAIIEELKSHLRVAQQRMKTQADKSYREVSFNIGDMVFL